MLSFNRKIVALLSTLSRQRLRQRLSLQRAILLLVVGRRHVLLRVTGLLVELLTILEESNSVPNPRSGRRLRRNGGWWDLVWTTYSDERFKKTFHVSKGTFQFILERLYASLKKETVTEEPISPECRLAVCLYRLGRGDYIYTISELAGIGESTVCGIIIEVFQLIVENFWQEYVAKFWPDTEEKVQELMEMMDSEWHFTSAYGAIDGSHIPIHCSPGGAEAAKEYHTFKNFYSVVLMAIVDAKYRSIWGSCGYPGNSHDSLIFKSTDLYAELSSGKMPSIAHKEGSVLIPPLLLGDGAFPFHSWLMKPYSQAVLTAEEKYVNYRLSRARMVAEGAFGKVKGRWRILSRKCESTVDTVKAMTLACVVLYNLCIERGDVSLRHWDMTQDPETNERRPSEGVRDLLHMTSNAHVCDSNKQAGKIREALKKKFFKEKQNNTL